MAHVTEAVLHRFEPRGAALTLFHDRSREVLLTGPAGTGKSRACLEKLHAVALANPGMRGLILRKTLRSLGSTALETWRSKVVPEALAAGILHYYGGSSEEPPQYRYSNGSAIVIGGLDNPTRIMSSEYDMIYIQEAIELNETDWESVTTRLRNGVVSFQQLIADTNPAQPTHWLKARCDRGDTKMHFSAHEDNPVLANPDGTLTEFGATYIGGLDKLTGVRKDRLRHGRWVAAEGVIYEDFRDDIHVIDGFPIPADWSVFLSIDFGFTNPFVCQWWCEDPDGRLYLFREIYRTGQLVEDHARDIIRLSGGPEKVEQIAAIVCDHDAEDRATLTRHLGRSTRSAKKEVSVGIQEVQARMRVAEDGRPRIYIFRNARAHRADPELEARKLPKSTLEEIPGYSWEPPKEGKAPKESPVKENDHGCDAMRYMAMHRQRGPMKGTRFL